MSIEPLEARIARLEKQNRELLDRQEILDVVVRFGRAVDRLDRELLLSCFHPDAVDDHQFFIGSPLDLVAATLERDNKYQLSSHHSIASHLCELQGDVAHAESYYYCAVMNPSDPPLYLVGGRYIDRFERRDGRWAIAHRVQRMEWWGQPGPMNPPVKINPYAEHEPARNRMDPSYERPLVVTQKDPGYSMG